MTYFNTRFHTIKILTLTLIASISVCSNSYGMCKHYSPNIHTSIHTFIYGLVLDLSHTDITDEQLEEAFYQYPTLHTIKLDHCKNLHFNINNWPSNLKNICLTKVNITAEKLNHLFQQCINLNDIDLASCSELDIDAVRWPASLTRIQLSNSTITDEQLNSIFEKCPNLSYIYLERCNELHFKNIQWPTSLKWIDLSLIDFSEGSHYRDFLCKNFKDLCKQLPHTMIITDSMVRHIWQR